MGGRLVGAIGLASSIVGIVSWLGTTPKTAGNAVYGIVRATFPFLMTACGSRSDGSPAPNPFVMIKYKYLSFLLLIK